MASSMEIKSEVSSLKVKLKMPKEEVVPQPEVIIKNNTPRVCHVCDKVFSSGKALGGHMRIHVQSNNDLPVSKKKKLASSVKQTLPDRLHCDEADQDQFDEDDLMMGKKPVCSICDRVFPSMKSLSGHLRCHPDRAWRGIQPPDDQSGKAEQFVTSSNSFSPDSSLSDAELSSWSDQDEGEQGVVVDLSQTLSSSWVVTARRGRKGTGLGSTSEADSSSLEDEVLLQAAKDLMMLSRGLKSGKGKAGCGEAEAPRRAKSGVDPVSRLKGKRKIGELKIYEEKVSHEVEKSSKKLVCYSSDDDEVELASKVLGKDVVEEVENRNVLMKKVKKKTKKVMKLCDLDQNVTPLKHKASAVTCDKYTCDTCDKSFPSHQALGGHMSSHNKFKLYIFNSMDVEETQGSSSQVVSPGEVSDPCRRVLDFDLNEKLPSDEDDQGGFGSGFTFGNSL